VLFLLAMIHYHGIQLNLTSWRFVGPYLVDRDACDGHVITLIRKFWLKFKFDKLARSRVHLTWWTKTTKTTWFPSFCFSIPPLSMSYFSLV
jgi:hypothetical protein